MIKIYTQNETTGGFSPVSSADFSAPIIASTRPGGTAFTKRVFIRNDDPSTYYTDIALRPTTFNGLPISGSVIRVKLLSGSKAPEDFRWDAVGANGSESVDPAVCAILQSPMGVGAADTRLPELGVEGTPDNKYYPFWVRIEVGKGAPYETLMLGLSVSYTENAI